MKGHHPDIGHDYWPIDPFADQEAERKRREQEAAKLKEWNPLGRWLIKQVKTSTRGRHPISGSVNMGAYHHSTTYRLVDTWKAHPELKSFTDVYTGYDSMNGHFQVAFRTEDDAINHAKIINEATLNTYKKELSALYIHMVESALDNAYNQLHRVREAVDKYKSFVELNDTLEGSDG